MISFSGIYRMSKQKMHRKGLCFVRFLLIVPIMLFVPLHFGLCQEQLRPLTVNPEIISRNAEKVTRLKSAALIDTIKLPFVDDFSSTTVFPNSRFWIDKKAYINSTYAVNPPSIGVATLDAVDENGKLYPSASSKPFYADELTSKPIRIDSSLRNVILSFFYQPGGISDLPDSTDYLMVDFYNADSAKWFNVVKIRPDKNDSSFQQKAIRVPVEFYRKSFFQFRFRNIASIDGSEIMGKHGNVDFWNIDYVRLDAGRSETDLVLRDLAIQKPQTSVLKTYYSMPWKQFKKSFQVILKPTISLDVINNHPDSVKYAKSPTFEFTKTSGEYAHVVIDGPGTNIPPKGTFSITTDLPNPFAGTKDGTLPEIKYEIKSYITTNTSDNHWNDTTRFTQVFSNYYAYDDGSAEIGYGLFGDGTQNGRVAYAFTAYAQDTLKGIRFYFSPTEKDTSQSFQFDLAIWGDNKGIPGSIIYRKSGDRFTPKTGSLNNFYTFELDSGVVVSGRFYIGWLQKNEEFLNVGMDLNNNNSDKLFYNLSGIWKNSETKGTLMLRPVFTSATEGFPTGIPKAQKGNFQIYPNPASDLVYIRTESQTSSMISVKIFNVAGTMVLSTFAHDKTFDVGQLPEGLYIVQISMENTTFAPVKLMIHR